MLVNCPKCGFSQPQDQYCARCGVDMQAYKPKETPLFTKVISSTAFQISVLAVVALIAVQFIFNNSKTQKISQKTKRVQGVVRSETGRTYAQTEAGADGDESETETDIPSVGNSGFENSSRTAKGAESDSAHGATNAATDKLNSKTVGTGEQDALLQGKLNVTYAEVPVETINRWITESSNLGLYQSLTDYSVGILPDFRKRNENFTELKTYNVEFKPQVGSNTNISGVMSDDGNQLIGFSTMIEKTGRLNDGTLLGQITFSKRGRAESETYPSEFELAKGSAFFMIGALKVENFQSERAKLQMPPFQIFKSNEFMTRKTEFVIIIEPDYK